MAENMVEQLLVDIDAEIFIANAFDIDICVRGYHFFNQIWQPTIGENLLGVHENNPISLAKDKYAVAMKTVNGLTVGHVPRFMSKYTYFFIRHGGIVKARVSGPRRYSEDLDQGGVEIPTVYTFTCENNLVFNKFKLEITRLVDEYMLT